MIKRLQKIILRNKKPDRS